MASEIKVDTISEKTSANGVTIDGVSLKDSKIATANSVDSDAYVDGSIDTAHIDALQVTGAKLNTDVISAQTELAVAPASTDEFMVSDAGVLKRVDFSYMSNTPAFMVVMGTDDTLSTSSYTKATFDNEVFDTDSAFASDKFTVPSGGAGKYVIHCHVYLSTIDDGNNVEGRIYKNGSDAGSWAVGSATLKWDSAGANKSMDMGWTWIGTLEESDYIELYVAQYNGDDQTLYRRTWMAGFRLIGV